jgi:hypothetical protein
MIYDLFIDDITENDKQMKQVKQLIIIVFLGFGLAGFWACGNNDEKNNKAVADTIKDYSLDNLDEAFDRAVIVFYALPSPVETARLFKRAGAPFDETLLNPTSNFEKYFNTRAMALNLGIYGADLSYANLFEQAQITLNYFATTKKMAENMGILEAVGDSTLEALRNNITDRDFVMGVISDVFMNSQAYLKENNRPEVATIIIAGGWIEGLYIGTQLAVTKAENQEPLINAVADQNLSINDLLNLLMVYKDHNDVKSIIKDVETIKKHLSVIKNAEGKVNMDDFKKMTDEVARIRNAYIQ